ncbi:MAG TPA: flagellar motor protein MotB [Burkholderiales bacterium]|nr:flagellar motor protein MotB [Burkholderiales bacterium]
MNQPEQAPEGARAARPRPAPSQEAIFDGGDALIDDGIMRANWAVPWSDLMMTMFVLFAVLLAAQMLHERLGEAARQQQQQRVVELREQAPKRETLVNEEAPQRKPSFEPLVRINVFARSQEVVREANLQNAEIVLMDDQSVKVSVQGPTFFALGKADLRPEVTRFLTGLAQIIKQTPYEIHVIGHTDDRPISTSMFPSNWELSLVRASRVARYLISAGNLEPSRFLVMGRGEYEPAATNTDARSRALNRRVEIIITRTVTDSEKEKQG